ncbi:MAG: hypothetical protein JRD89_18645 [Deltaproteobacteria bacterium]|nr:hypothetical protein [Deltaproteobacteria bacterium]
MALLRLTDVRPDDEIRRLVEEVVANAEAEWAPLKYEGQYPVGGFGITELRPKHIRGGTHNIPSSVTWSASIATASTYFDWMDLTLTDMAYVIQTGVFNLEASPRVTEIAPSANGQDLPTVNLEQMYALDLARVWHEKPFAARPNNNFKNQLVGRDTGVERIGLLGYCVAKRAYLILR